MLEKKLAKTWFKTMAIMMPIKAMAILVPMPIMMPIFPKGHNSLYQAK